MGKYLLITALVTITTGILGFYTNTDFTSMVRIFFYISIDILTILLLAKFVFTSETTKKVENIKARKSIQKSKFREIKYPKVEHRIPARMETSI